MNIRPLVRGLVLSGSLILVVLLSVLAARSLWKPSQPAPAEEPAHSDDESEVLMAGATIPTTVATPRTILTPAAGSAAPASRPAASAPAPASVTTISGVPGVAGMVIGLDPETGTWGPPTREQLHELEEIHRRTEADAHRVAKPGWLPEVRHPDGHVSVDLNGQFQEFTTVRIGPDGKPVFTCVQGPEAAERTVAEPAPALEER